MTGAGIWAGWGRPGLSDEWGWAGPGDWDDGNGLKGPHLTVKAKPGTKGLYISYAKGFHINGMQNFSCCSFAAMRKLCKCTPKVCVCSFSLIIKKVFQDTKEDFVNVHQSFCMLLFNDKKVFKGKKENCVNANEKFLDAPFC